MVESNKVYEKKIRINHWQDKLMEHKKIYYAAELKMYQLEMTLAKWDNSGKLRWSVRNCEFPSPVYHEEKKPKVKPWMEEEEKTKEEDNAEKYKTDAKRNLENAEARFYLDYTDKYKAETSFNLDGSDKYKAGTSFNFDRTDKYKTQRNLNLERTDRYKTQRNVDLDRTEKYRSPVQFNLDKIDKESKRWYDYY